VSRSWLRVSKGVSSVQWVFQNISWVSGKLPEGFQRVFPVFSEFLDVSECLECCLRFLKSIWEIFGEFPECGPEQFTEAFKWCFRCLKRVFSEVSWVSGELPENFWKSIQQYFKNLRVSRSWLRVSKGCPVSSEFQKFPECPESCLRFPKRFPVSQWVSKCFLSVRNVAWEFLKEHLGNIWWISRVCPECSLRLSNGVSSV